MHLFWNRNFFWVNGEMSNSWLQNLPSVKMGTTSERQQGCKYKYKYKYTNTNSSTQIQIHSHIPLLAKPGEDGHQVIYHYWWLKRESFSVIVEDGTRSIIVLKIHLQSSFSLQIAIFLNLLVVFFFTYIQPSPSAWMRQSHEADAADVNRLSSLENGFFVNRQCC